MIEMLKLNNVATYDNSGIIISDLKLINFIYGANGCGKTTISNFIQDSSDPKYKDCSITWKNNTPVKALVYNKAFRDKNFGKGRLNGVFTLGEATAEQIKVIEEKSEKLKTIKAEGVQKRETLDKLKSDKDSRENDYRETTWSMVYKKHEKDFKEAFVGTLQKETFKAKIIQENTTNTERLEAVEVLRERAKIIFGEQPQRIESIAQIVFKRIVEIESNVIWKKIIVGKADVDIARLIQRLNIHDWVNQGRAYISGTTCPFCQKNTLTDEFKAQLVGFFDESYANDISQLRQLKQEYDALIQNLINQLNATETKQKEFGKTKLDLEKYTACLKTLISQLAVNKEFTLNKLKEPSRSIDVQNLEEQYKLISGLIGDANAAIAKHNAIVDNYTTERGNLIKSIWRFVVEEHKPVTTLFLEKKNGLETGIQNLERQLNEKIAEYRKRDGEIKELSKNVTSIQPTINEINRVLKYYGFTNFEIVPTQDQGFYQIQREDGSIADMTLSEGEITFITFLYYLQLAKGGLSESEVKSERILIIDDPISSLDSSVLFVVSTLIKRLIKDVKDDVGSIKQIVILTHNVYFHKEVSFIDGRTKTCNTTNFWILRKCDKVTHLQSFGMENPIQTSYGLLWKELKSGDVRSYVSIQNIMRRIIENYFKLLGKLGDDEILQKFTNKEEQDVCRSLISWINDGSHGINDDVYIERQDRTIDMYKKVFREIFVLSDHEGHYNMMMNTGG